MKIKKVDDNTVSVKIKGDRYQVTHIEDYGVLVRGTTKVKRARKVLLAVGYPTEGVHIWPHRPTMVDQEPSEWPRGNAVGGVPAVAFYFEVG